MRKLLLVTEDRSERGLLESIMIELKKRNNIEAKWCVLSPARYPLGQNTIEQFKSHLAIFKPDIVCVPCDRDIMVYVAAHAFHEGYIVCHVLHAGDTGSGISDESNRFAISFMSHILICNSVQSAENLYKMGFEFWRVHVVGSTALNGIVEIDESLCPKEPYDLVLLHPDPISAEQTEKDFKETLERISTERLTIWFEPNLDANHKIIRRGLDMILSHSHGCFPSKVYEHLPRPQYLGLLANCKRGIGNSSSFIYELPLLNPKAERIMIGKRNSEERTPPNTELGASARIAEILATIPIDDKLRRKKLIL